MTMRDHVEGLAKMHGVRVNYIDSAGSSHAHPELKAICVSPVRDDITYAVALHELGHCVAPGAAYKGSIADGTMRMLCERVAWNWARANARKWTANMQHALDFGLTSHSMPRKEMAP